MSERGDLEVNPLLAGKKAERCARRTALDLAAQLPADRQQALTVVRHLQWLVENYFDGGGDVIDCREVFARVKSGGDPS